MGTRNAKTAERRASNRRDRNRREGVTFADVNGESLLKLLDIVAAKGGALRLGTSRDGGAFSVGVYGDGEPYTEYVGKGEDINEYFEGLAAYFSEFDPE